MRYRFRIGILALLAIGALTVAMTGIVLAQEETPLLEKKPFGWHGWGRGFSRGMSGGQAGLEAAAEVLGFETVDELVAQLWGGKTLADLAEDADVPLEALRDAIDAANRDAMLDAINQAVEDGTLSSEHGAWLKDGLENGYLGGHGFGGFGGHPGCGRFRGRRGFPGGDNGSGIFNHFRRQQSDA